MNRLIRNIVVCIKAFSCIWLMSSFQHGSKKEVDSFMAVNIGYKKFVELYGKDRIEDELPITATLQGDSVWAVAGTLTPTLRMWNGKMVNVSKGGASYMFIRKSDGTIKEYGHGK